MLASVFTFFKRPVFVLLASFLVGVLIDALAERIAAQDGYAPPAYLLESPLFKTRQAFLLQEPGGDVSPSDIPINRQQVDIPDLADLATPIMDIRISVKDPAENKPADSSQDLFALLGHSNYPNSFQQRLAMWRAADIRYQPLYYEDVGLERYGQTRGPLIQPFISAGHLAASQTLILYNLFVEPPHVCTYPLGFCRPGSLAPITKNRWLWARP